MITILIILALALALSFFITVKLIRRFNRLNKKHSQLLEDFSGLFKDASILDEQNKKYLTLYHNSIHTVGEMLYQIAYQVTEKELSEEEIKTNCEHLKMIGDKLKALSQGIISKDEKLSNALCQLSGRTDHLPINETNLLRLATFLFTDNYKQRILMFK